MRRPNSFGDGVEAFLIYADALLAAGDRRGELINVQHAFATRPDPYTAWELQANERTLLSLPALAPQGFVADALRWRLGHVAGVLIEPELDESELQALLAHDSCTFVEHIIVRDDAVEDTVDLADHDAAIAMGSRLAELVATFGAQLTSMTLAGSPPMHAAVLQTLLAGATSLRELWLCPLEDARFPNLLAQLSSPSELRIGALPGVPETLPALFEAGLVSRFSSLRLDPDVDTLDVLVQFADELRNTALRAKPNITPKQAVAFALVLRVGMDRPLDALAVLEEASPGSRSRPASIERGNALCMLGRHDEALVAWREGSGITWDPLFNSAWHNIGVAHSRRGGHVDVRDAGEPELHARLRGTQGALGQMVDVPVADLVAGDNTLEWVMIVDAP